MILVSDIIKLWKYKGKSKGDPMNIKMIVTDLDKTLLRSDKTISDFTKQIFSACSKEGILLAFASARSEMSCMGFAKQVSPFAIISSSGSLARIGETVIYRAAVNQDITNKLLQLCLEQSQVGFITADTDVGHLVNQPVDENDPNWTDYLPVYETDFTKGLKGDSYKIAAEIHGLDSHIIDAIPSTFPTVRVVPFAGENWFCFTDKLANKFNGVKALANHMNIPIKDVIAFGDDYSDIEMIRDCGVGVAMENAIAEVKAVADYICDTNDNDGVAKWLQKHLL